MSAIGMCLEERQCGGRSVDGVIRVLTSETGGLVAGCGAAARRRKEM